MSDRKVQCIPPTSRVKVCRPTAYHLSNAYCYYGRLGVIILLRLRCRQKYFSCFLGTKISESSAYVFNSKSAAPEPIWLKFGQLIVRQFASKNVSAIFVFFFRFRSILIFSKEVLIICLLWLYPIVTNEQMHVSKIWDTVFLAERVKKQMRCLSFSSAHS